MQIIQLFIYHIKLNNLYEKYKRLLTSEFNPKTINLL